MPNIKAATVLELFEGHPERWIKHRSAVNASNQTVAMASPEACKWCLVGAFYKVYADCLTIVQALERCRKVLPSEFGSICELNDASASTFEQVLDVVRKASV